jgi:hypothetical protein
MTLANVFDGGDHLLSTPDQLSTPFALLDMTFDAFEKDPFLHDLIMGVLVALTEVDSSLGGPFPLDALGPGCALLFSVVVDATRLDQLGLLFLAVDVAREGRGDRLQVHLVIILHVHHQPFGGEEGGAFCTPKEKATRLLRVLQHVPFKTISKLHSKQLEA